MHLLSARRVTVPLVPWARHPHPGRLEEGREGPCGARLPLGPHTLHAERRVLRAAVTGPCSPEMPPGTAGTQRALSAALALARPPVRWGGPHQLRFWKRFW